MELKDLYCVKFQRNGSIRYGIVYSTDEKTKKMFEKGILIVHDAIRPSQCEIPVEKITPVSLEYGGEFDQYIDAELAKANAHSAAQKGINSGSLFTVGVADGVAYYIVTKVKKRKVKIEWRGFAGNSYKSKIFGAGGTFDINVIEPLVRLHSGVENIFAQGRIALEDE